MIMKTNNETTAFLQSTPGQKFMARLEKRFALIPTIKRQDWVFTKEKCQRDKLIANIGYKNYHRDKFRQIKCDSTCFNYFLNIKVKTNQKGFQLKLWATAYYILAHEDYLQKIALIKNWIEDRVAQKQSHFSYFEFSYFKNTIIFHQSNGCTLAYRLHKHLSDYSDQAIINLCNHLTKLEQILINDGTFPKGFVVFGTNDNFTVDLEYDDDYLVAKPLLLEPWWQNRLDLYYDLIGFCDESHSTFSDLKQVDINEDFKISNFNFANNESVFAYQNLPLAIQQKVNDLINAIQIKHSILLLRSPCYMTDVSSPRLIQKDALYWPVGNNFVVVKKIEWTKLNQPNYFDQIIKTIKGLTITCQILKQDLLLDYNEQILIFDHDDKFNGQMKWEFKHRQRLSNYNETKIINWAITLEKIVKTLKDENGLSKIDKLQYYRHRVKRYLLTIDWDTILIETWDSTNKRQQLTISLDNFDDKEVSYFVKVFEENYRRKRWKDWRNLED